MVNVMKTRKITLELDSKTLVMLAGIISTAKSDELFELYEELTGYLTAHEASLVSEFWYKYINYNDEEDIYYTIIKEGAE